MTEIGVHANGKLIPWDEVPEVFGKLTPLIMDIEGRERYLKRKHADISATKICTLESWCALQSFKAERHHVYIPYESTYFRVKGGMIHDKMFGRSKLAEMYILSETEDGLKMSAMPDDLDLEDGILWELKTKVYSAPKETPPEHILQGRLVEYGLRNGVKFLASEPDVPIHEKMEVDTYRMLYMAGGDWEYRDYKFGEDIERMGEEEFNRKVGEGYDAMINRALVGTPWIEKACKSCSYARFCEIGLREIRNHLDDKRWMRFVSKPSFKEGEEVVDWLAVFGGV